MNDLHDCLEYDDDYAVHDCLEYDDDYADGFKHLSPILASAPCGEYFVCRQCGTLFKTSHILRRFSASLRGSMLRVGQENRFVRTRFPLDEAKLIPQEQIRLAMIMGALEE